MYEIKIIIPFFWSGYKHFTMCIYYLFVYLLYIMVWIFMCILICITEGLREHGPKLFKI